MSDHQRQPGLLPLYFCGNVRETWKRTDGLVADIFLR